MSSLSLNMIRIIDKHKCCGCSACVQICPKKCISFQQDMQGFKYPEVDDNICVKCGKCQKVCPVLNHSEPQSPINVYAAINPDEDIRAMSSSGGVFSALAELIINQGGVVFGASFNNKWEVIHSYAESISDTIKFRGSKYVQSNMGDNYTKVRDILLDGRIVLFSGTPCQIMGLKKFLQKDYDNLVTVSVVCHGVPSPLVWQTYLDNLLLASPGQLTDISFRDKSTGWNNYNFRVNGVRDGAETESEFVCEPFRQNLYMQLFSTNLSLRPSCFQCPANDGKSRSDIVIADYWGVDVIHPEISDNKGTSLVLVYTNKGMNYWDSLVLTMQESTYDTALKYNPCIKDCVKETVLNKLFWNIFSRSRLANINPLLKVVRSYRNVSYILNRILTKLKAIIK